LEGNAVTYHSPRVNVNTFHKAVSHGRQVAISSSSVHAINRADLLDEVTFKKTTTKENNKKCECLEIFVT
jgi:hypothetical protein